MYHLESTSKRPIVFAHIKVKIYVLAATADEDPDIMEVQLITHCWLDRARLVRFSKVRLVLLTLNPPH